MGLRVRVDGVLLSDGEARSVWERFSAWMDEHRGDLAGFARSEGFASVHPEMHAAEAVLVASHTAKQCDYVSAPRRSGPKNGKKRRR